MIHLFRRFGMTLVFDGDGEVGDANNPDVNGGGDDPSKAGGGGDDPSKKDVPDKFDLVVNGQTRQVTIDELKTLAQKSAGADAKFQDAANLRKSAEDGIRMQELIGRIRDESHTPTESELKEFAGLAGIDSGEFMKWMNEDEEADPPQMGNDKTTSKIDRQQLAEALGFDPAEAKGVLEYAHKSHIEQARKEIREMSDKAVEKDEIFGKIIDRGEGKDDRLKAIQDLVAEDVLNRIKDGEQFGAELIAASVQKMRAYLGKFGTPGKPDKHLIAMGLIPSGGLPSEIHSETPIKRVSAADDGDDSNFVKRAMQRMLKLKRDEGQR